MKTDGDHVTAKESIVSSFVNILDNLGDGIAILNYNWTYLYANTAYSRQTLYNSGNINDKSIFKACPDFESSILYRLSKIVMKERTPQFYESEFTYNDGSIHWLRFKINPVPDEIFLYSQDISDKKLAEKKEHDLLELIDFRTAKLNAIIESIPDAVLVGNLEGITRCNNKALKLLGVNSKEELNNNIEIIAKNINARRPDTGIPYAKEELQFVRALKGETVEEEVLFTNIQTGKDVVVRVACAPVIQHGKVVAAVAVQSDITSRKHVERINKASLKEKELLLKEIYHRTKNNMQLISSLLSIKASSLKNLEAASILNEMKTRIGTISTLHEILYKSNDHIQIDLGGYIANIIKLLVESFIDEADRISIKMEFDEILVHIDTAVSCGLIVNELITNSLKYAFPGDRKGEILVKLTNTDETIKLSISDNGVGYEIKKAEDGQLGLQMFKIIAEGQLEAETDIHINNGVSVEIRFRDNEYYQIRIG